METIQKSLEARRANMRQNTGKLLSKRTRNLKTSPDLNQKFNQSYQHSLTTGVHSLPKKAS